MPQNEDLENTELDKLEDSKYTLMTEGTEQTNPQQFLQVKSQKQVSASAINAQPGSFFSSWMHY